MEKSDVLIKAVSFVSKSESLSKPSVIKSELIESTAESVTAINSEVHQEKSQKCLKKLKVKSVIHLDAHSKSLSSNHSASNTGNSSFISNSSFGSVHSSATDSEFMLKKSCSVTSRDSVASVSWNKGRMSLFYRRLDSYPRVKDYSLDGFRPFIGSLSFNDINHHVDLNYIVKIDYSKPKETIAAAIQSYQRDSSIISKRMPEKNKILRKLKIKEIKKSYTSISTTNS